MPEKDKKFDAEFHESFPEKTGFFESERVNQEELLIEAKNFFEAHKKELLEARRKGSNVAFLDFESLSKFSKILSDEIIENPEDTLRIIEQAIEQSPLIETIRVRLENFPKSSEVKIRK